MDKRKIIMDCDPGIDDAIALAFAAAHPESFEMLAVTGVSGNQSVDTVTQNALDLVAFYGMDIPVARGMEQPLIRETEYASDFHGENGLGNIEIPRSPKQPAEEMAVFYLKKRIMELPEDEKVTLICTAPLTNIAMLLKLFPEVKTKIEEIVLMGGAVAGGNVTASAEFNIYIDPEAARIVFRSGIPLVMCGLDATNECALTRSQILKLNQSTNKIARFCGEMAAYSLDNGHRFEGKVSIHDAVPYMYLLHPEIFKTKKAKLDVECSDCASRGRTICDFRWWMYEEEEESTILMDVNVAKFQEYLIEALFELGEKLAD